MIPEEVAQIAAIIRDAYQWEHDVDPEAAFAYSIDVAWEIYNKVIREPALRKAF